MQPAKLSLSLSRSPADVIVGERIFTDDRPRERPSNALPLYGHLSFRLISRLGGRPFRSPHVHRPEEHPNSVSTHVRSPPPPRIYGVLSKTPPSICRLVGRLVFLSGATLFLLPAQRRGVWCSVSKKANEKQKRRKPVGFCGRTLFL